MKRLAAARKHTRLKHFDRYLAKKEAQVRVLLTAKSSQEFLIIPYHKHTEAELDAEMKTPIGYKIFRKQNGRWKGVYESDGEPLFFGDLDGDGVPEVLRTPYCDGTCEYYETFFPSTAPILGYNAHE
jgi:hypothetical protein